MEFSADTFNKFALGAVAVISMIVGPWVQWKIAKRQAKLQEDVAVRQAALQEAIAKRQVADSIATRRQAWIDGLRADVATLLATYAQVMNLYAIERNPTRALSDAALEKERLYSLWERSAVVMAKAAEISARVRLRLNPTEKEHQQMMSLIDAVREIIDRAYQIKHAESAMADWIQRRQEIMAITSTILKSEWERVKRGDV